MKYKRFTYLIIVISDGEISDKFDHLMKEFGFVFVLGTIPQ